MHWSGSIGSFIDCNNFLLDLTGDAALVGKPLGSDAENDKNTFASVYGIEKCEAMIAELTERALKHAEAFGKGLWP